MQPVRTEAGLFIFKEKKGLCHDAVMMQDVGVALSRAVKAIFKLTCRIRNPCNEPPSRPMAHEIPIGSRGISR